MREEAGRGGSHLLSFEKEATLVCGPGMKALPYYPNMMLRFDAPGNEAASNNCKTCRVKPTVTIPGNPCHEEETPGLFTFILICNRNKLES